MSYENGILDMLKIPPQFADLAHNILVKYSAFIEIENFQLKSLLRIFLSLTKISLTRNICDLRIKWVLI